MNPINAALNTDTVRSFNLAATAKILFAAFPGDGYFNPLISVAAHLKKQGYDVRFYTSIQYREKIERMNIRLTAFVACNRGYFNLGTNLKTELPAPDQIRKSVEAVVDNDIYRKNATALNKEFSNYNALQLTQRYVEQLLPMKQVLHRRAEESVY